MSGIFRTREAQRQEQAGKRVGIYTSTHACESGVTTNLSPGRYARLPWNDVFRTVMTRMEPAAKQGCVLHPSVCTSQYSFRTLAYLSSQAKTHLHSTGSCEGTRFPGPFYLRRRYPRKVPSDWECCPNSAGDRDRADVRDFTDASQPGLWRPRGKQSLMH